MVLPILLYGCEIWGYENIDIIESIYVYFWDIFYLWKKEPHYSCYMENTDRITHTTSFVTPVVEHWLEWEIAQWVPPMKDRSDDPPHHEQTLYLWATSRSL